MIGRAVQHARDCGAVGTFLLSFVSGALWWPMICRGAHGVVKAVTVARAYGWLTLAGRPFRPHHALLFVGVDYRPSAVARDHAIPRAHPL